jgi:hypothetical protein
LGGERDHQVASGPVRAEFQVKRPTHLGEWIIHGVAVIFDRDPCLRLGLVPGTLRIGLGKAANIAARDTRFLVLTGRAAKAVVAPGPFAAHFSMPTTRATRTLSRLYHIPSLWAERDSGSA